MVRLNIAYSQIGQHVPLLRHVLEKIAVLRTCRQLRQLAVFLGTLSVLGHDAHWARPCASHDIESRVESSQSACQAARENYHEARDLFRQAAQELGAHLENHVVLSGAEYGGDLTIDVAVVGVEDPTWSLVVSSGLHGVEGFFGSALQTAYLRQVQRQDVIDSKGQLVLIHAINPFGFLRGPLVRRLQSTKRAALGLISRRGRRRALGTLCS